MRFAFQFVFAIFGLAIAYSLFADQLSNATLFLGAAVGWLGIVWVALATA